MKTKGLLTPEIIAAKVLLDEAREVYSAAQTKVLTQLDVVDALQNEFWEAHISEFNLDDPEDLMLVADAAWDNGRGNPVISQYLRNWIVSKSKYFTEGTWFSKKNENDIALPIVTLVLPCTLSDKEVSLLSTSILQLNETFKAVNEEYRFGVMENSCGEHGSYQLLVVSSDEAHVMLYSYGDNTQLVDSLEACLKFISKNAYYCSCSKHSLDSEEYY